MIIIKRIYDPVSDCDGYRILVDRLWPRGVVKEQARIDEWMRDIAPSPELRKWFVRRPERFAEFQVHYVQELEQDPTRRRLAERIIGLSIHQKVTLIYAKKDSVHNHAAVLRDWLTDTFPRQ